MDLDFSVVVPTQDRPDQIRECVAALARLDYPADSFEVVVVDDGSRTPVRVDDLKADGLALRVERQLRGGPARARNRGVGVARGRWIAFTDDDCRPAPDWLDALAGQLSAGARAVAGRTVNALPGDGYAEASQALVDHLLRWYNSDRRDARFGTSNNLAVDRATLVAIGGFDDAFTGAAAEDRELVHRLRERGHPIAYEPDARVEHWHALSGRQFLRQHYGYGRGAVLFHRRIGRVPVAPVGFYRELARIPDARTTALVALAQAANAVGFGVERLRAAARG